MPQARCARPHQRGCIVGGPEMEKHVSGATYAGAGWSGRPCWSGLGISQQASAGKCQAGGQAGQAPLSDSMRSCARRRV